MLDTFLSNYFSFCHCDFFMRSYSVVSILFFFLGEDRAKVGHSLS